MRATSYFELFDKTAEEPIRFAKEVVHYLTQSKTPYEAPFEESFRVMYLIINSFFDALLEAAR